MKRLGMTLPLQSLPLAEHADWVRELEDLGYSDVWTSEAQDVDGLVPLALASQWAPGLRLGCACLPVQTRGPGTLAMGISALCDTAPGRVVVGLGCSSEPIVRHWNALPFEKPYQRTRDTVRFLRAALAGEKVDHGLRDLQRARLPAAPQGRPAAADPRRRAPRRHARAGRARGRRRDPQLRDPRGSAEGDPPREEVRRREGDRRPHLRVPDDATPSACAPSGACRSPAYFNVPTYRAHQEWLGRAPLLAPMWEAWSRGDRRGALAALPDAVVDAFYIHGSAEAVPRAHRRLPRRGPRHADHRPRRGGDGPPRGRAPAGAALSDAFGDDPGRGPAGRQLRTTR